MKMPNSLRNALALWLLAALAIGASGVLSQLKPPVPQIIILSTTIVALGLSLRCSTWRNWLKKSDPKLLVLFHFTRFVGSYFLLLYMSGELPYDFAVPGGIGDIFVASFAAILVVFVSPLSPTGRRLYQLWNVFGLIDILFVISTAVRLSLNEAGSMQALLHLPLNLLLTFIVPMILATHLWLFAKLRSTSH